MSVLPAVYSNIELAIQQAKTPEESHKLESVAQAARAYYREQQDYEAMTKAVEAYYMARRKTTELILPFIQNGGEGNTHVTLLSDFGITKMQWHRRVREYEIEQEKAIEYFDSCIAKGWNPSIAGMMKYSDGNHDCHNGQGIDFFQSDCKSFYNKALALVDNYRNRFTDHELAVLAMVIDTFQESK